MNFNPHYNLKGKHALFGASNYHWLNYDDEKLAQFLQNNMIKQRGTELHDLAQRLIELGVNLPRSKKTLNMYVNDAIGFRMHPEQLLYFSDYFFGTADAISFTRNFLRIHDLKTGVSQASMSQLIIYAALFCLEYFIEPEDIEIELRIYQNDDIIIFRPEADKHIRPVMDKIRSFDQQIRKLREEGVAI